MKTWARTMRRAETPIRRRIEMTGVLRLSNAEGNYYNTLSSSVGVQLDWDQRHALRHRRAQLLLLTRQQLEQGPGVHGDRAAGEHDDPDLAEHIERQLIPWAPMATLVLIPADGLGGDGRTDRDSTGLLLGRSRAQRQR